jgi:hypothetical protein
LTPKYPTSALLGRTLGRSTGLPKTDPADGWYAAIGCSLFLDQVPIAFLTILSPDVEKAYGTIGEILTLWDEIAAAVLIEPSVVLKAELMHLEVNIDHQKDDGAVLVLPNEIGERNVHVIEQVADLFKAKFVDSMTGQSSACPSH